MEPCGAALYGDPCRDCGFQWELTPASAVRVVSHIPSRFAEALVGCSGQERHPELGWTAGGYVSHVADNLRIWAERLAGAHLSGDPWVAGYDQDLLAGAREYYKINLKAALWSLDWAARCWSEAVGAALASNVDLDPAERGEQRADDVARNNAHDACHHFWDVGRIVAHANQVRSGDL